METKKRIGIRVSPGIFEFLTQFKKDQNMSYSEVVEIALMAMYLQMDNKRSEDKGKEEE